jgi:hypothetical protein
MALKSLLLRFIEYADQMGCSKTSFPRFDKYARSNGELENSVLSLIQIDIL